MRSHLTVERSQAHLSRPTIGTGDLYFLLLVRAASSEDKVQLVHLLLRSARFIGRHGSRVDRSNHFDFDRDLAVEMET